jgi:hypothetical protein
VFQLFLARLLGWFVSSLEPITERERLIPSWPPQIPILNWFDRIWYAPLERWDTLYYILIVENGYRLVNGSAQFHPLFPLLASVLYVLGIPSLISLTFFSSLATLGILYTFYKLANLDMDPQKSTFAVLMLITSPFAFALFVPYSESLFILLTILSFYWCHTHRWWLACLSAGLATLTRQQGVVILLPLMWEFWESRDSSFRGFWHRPKRSGNVSTLVPTSNDKNDLAQNIWPFVLVPAAYVAWVVYRALVINESVFDFSSFNGFIYSFLISPNAFKVVPVQSFMFPWRALFLAFRHLWATPDWDIAMNLGWGVYYLVLLGIGWKQLRKSYRIYCLATTILSFSYHTGRFHPYMGLIRHLLLGFPVFIALAAQIRKSTHRLAILSIGLIGLFMLLFSYYLEIWVP